MDDYMDKQIAADLLDNLIGMVEDNQGNDYNTALKMGIEALKAHTQPEQRWIPCNERMPDEDYWTGANFQYSADVLMTVYNAEDEETIIDYGHTANGSWYSDTTDGLVPPWWEVLAWMPLPEPYKEEAQDD